MYIKWGCERHIEVTELKKKLMAESLITYCVDLQAHPLPFEEGWQV